MGFTYLDAMTKSYNYSHSTVSKALAVETSELSVDCACRNQVGTFFSSIGVYVPGLMVATSIQNMHDYILLSQNMYSYFNIQDCYKKRENAGDFIRWM